MPVVSFNLAIEKDRMLLRELRCLVFIIPAAVCLPGACFRKPTPPGSQSLSVPVGACVRWPGLLRVRETRGLLVHGASALFSRGPNRIGQVQSATRSCLRQLAQDRTSPRLSLSAIHVIRNFQRVIPDPEFTYLTSQSAEACPEVFAPLHCYVKHQVCFGKLRLLGQFRRLSESQFLRSKTHPF